MILPAVGLLLEGLTDFLAGLLYATLRLIKFSLSLESMIADDLARRRFHFSFGDLCRVLCVSDRRSGGLLYFLVVNHCDPFIS